MKYGKPAPLIKIKKHKCIFKLTGRVSDFVEDQNTKYIWKNGTITSLLYYDITYLDDCKPYVRSYFTVSTPKYNDEIKACEEVTIRIKKSIELKKSKQDLSEF